MKMYYYNPNDYGSEYFVMAESKTQAHQYLIKYLKEMLLKEKDFKLYYQEDLKLWKTVNPLDATTFPKRYTLDEYEVGSVVHTEIS